MYEVITKRVAALDDMRKGLESATVLGKTSIDLMAKWPKVRSRFFPAPKADVIDATTLCLRLMYETDDDSASREARIYFEKYLAELSARGCTLIFLLLSRTW